MKADKNPETPRNLRAELAQWETIIRRADKQKLRQPLKKRMTPEAYTSWIIRQKVD